ncbi:hypothetical protein [Ligilactobacillus equi]
MEKILYVIYGMHKTDKVSVDKILKYHAKITLQYMVCQILILIIAILGITWWQDLKLFEYLSYASSLLVYVFFVILPLNFVRRQNLQAKRQLTTKEMLIRGFFQLSTSFLMILSIFKILRIM